MAVILDSADLTRSRRRIFAIALAGFPFLAATAIPWVSEFTSGPSLLDSISLSLFWWIYRGERAARWIAVVVAALSGTIAIYHTMLARAGGERAETLVVEASVGVLLLFSASVLFGSSALDEPGPAQSLRLNALPWHDSLLPRATSEPSDAPAVSRARRGGKLSPWLLGVVAIGSWVIPAWIAAYVFANPTPHDPEAPLEGDYSGWINLMLVVSVVGAYVMSLWFPVGALLMLPSALSWRHPARFLVLRPFNRAQLSRTLVGAIRAEVAPMGHCYTLADAAIRVSWWLRAPIVMGQLTTMAFRQRTIASPSDLEQLVRRMRVTWFRNLNWLASRKKMFPVACIHEAWRPCVMRLAAETDVLIVDLSGLGESLRWELGFLAHTRHIARTVFLVHKDFEAEVRSRLANLPGARDPSIILYGPKGLSEHGALKKAVLEILARPRARLEDERTALTAFLQSSDAEHAHPPAMALPKPVIGWGMGIALAGVVAVIVFVGRAQPGLLEPERPDTPSPALSKTAHDLAELSAALARQSPESATTAAALAAESLWRVPTPEADSTLRTVLSKLPCRDSSPGVGKAWSVALDGPARLRTATSSPRGVAEVGGALFGFDTESGSVSRLPWSAIPGAVMIDLAISDDGERIAVMTLEHGPPARTSQHPVADTVRVLTRGGDALWSRDSYGMLIGLGFVGDRLRVVTRPEKDLPSGCPSAGGTGEHWCAAVLEAETGQSLLEYQAHASAWRAQFSRDGSLMAVTTSWGVDLWSTTQHAQVSHIPGCFDGIVAISDDDRRVACEGRAYDRQGIRFGTVGAPEETMASLTAGVNVSSLALDSDGSVLLATQEDGALAVWDTRSQQLTARLPLGHAGDLALTAGQRAAVVSDEAGLSASIFRASDLIARACGACDVAISKGTFRTLVDGGEPARTCAVR